MTSLQKSLERLYARRHFGIKPGLEAEWQLLEKLGHPETAYCVIHVAGTNGKGSVCALITSVLRKAGLRVGLYTSPHLVRFNERIQIDGLPVSDGVVGVLLEKIEKIGYAGRWRLPGRGTNYTDEDYRAYRDKQDIEAYLLFDYFVTDKNGDAVREFELDSCLHVLWNASRQRQPLNVRDVLPVIINATNPQHYARPKALPPLVELLWAERERSRYTHSTQTVFLPPGDYRAELVLTEESWHSGDNDGGWWATVFVGPIAFTVTPPITSAPRESR